MGAPVPPVTAVSLQRICARRYNGRLASIHDARTNTFLLLLARRQCRASQVWIGAVSQPAVRTPPWATLFPPSVPSAHPGCSSPVPQLPVHNLGSPIPFPVSSVPTRVLQPCPSIPSAHPGCPNPIPLSPVLGVATSFLPWQIPIPSCHWTDRSPWNYSQWVPGHPLPGHRFCTALCTNSQCGL